ncbi:ANGP1 protein, partial [Polypterus senegalus]
MVQIQAKAVQNQTATMLEIGTNLLTQTAEQTRKLTDVEAQVLNQTSRIEIQLLENSLSTNKLEKQLLLQINELSKLHDRNSVLENKVLEIEAKHRSEVESIKLEKARLQQIVSRQTNTIESLEKQLHSASNNNSALQKQQLQLMDSVRTLVDLVTQGRGNLVLLLLILAPDWWLLAPFIVHPEVLQVVDRRVPAALPGVANMLPIQAQDSQLQQPLAVPVGPNRAAPNSNSLEVLQETEALLQPRGAAI